MSRSAVESTAGNATSACTQPSSCSQRADATPSFDVEVTHAGEEGQTDQLGELGTHLAGVAVDGVAPDEHEIERPELLDRGGERPRRRQGVGTGEGAVGDEHAVGGDVTFERPRDRLAQRVFGTRRTEGDEGARAVGVVREVDGLRHGAAAVRVHLEVETVALEPPVGAELHLFERGDLLDERGDTHDGSRYREGALRPQ